MNLIQAHDLVRPPFYQKGSDFVFSEYQMGSHVYNQRVLLAFEALKNNEPSFAQTLIQSVAQETWNNNPNRDEPWEVLLSAVMNKGWMMCIFTGRYDLLKPMVHMSHQALAEVCAWDEHEQHIGWMEMGKALISTLQDGADPYATAEAFLYTVQDVPSLDEMKPIFVKEAIYQNQLPMMATMARVWDTTPKQAMIYTLEMVGWLQYSRNNWIEEWENDLVHGEQYTKSMAHMIPLWHTQSTCDFHAFLYENCWEEDMFKWRPLAPTLQSSFENRTYPTSMVEVFDVLAGVLPQRMETYPLLALFPEEFLENPEQWIRTFHKGHEGTALSLHWKKQKSLISVLEKQHLTQQVHPQNPLGVTAGRKM